LHQYHHNQGTQEVCTAMCLVQCIVMLRSDFSFL